MSGAGPYMSGAPPYLSARRAYLSGARGGAGKHEPCAGAPDTVEPAVRFAVMRPHTPLLQAIGTIVYAAGFFFLLNRMWPPDPCFWVTAFVGGLGLWGSLYGLFRMLRRK